MRRASIAALLVCFSAAAMQLGLADGNAVIDGEPVNLKFSYAKHQGDEIVVLLTARPLPASSADTVGVEIHFDQRFNHLRTVIRGKTERTLDAAAVELQPALLSDRLIDAKVAAPRDSFQATFRTLIGDAGRFGPNQPASKALNDPTDVQKKIEHAVEYELDRPRSVFLAGGTPLPADGGEPGRVYLSYQNALRRNDLDAARKLVSKSRAEQLDILKVLGLSPSETANLSIRIVNGSIRGDQAVVNVTGIKPGRVASHGTVKLFREQGVWKYLSEQWHVGAADVLAAMGELERSKVAPLTTGNPLPAGGGEPGNVWRAFDRALQRGDVEALKKLVTRAEAESLSAHEIGTFNRFRPTDVRVVGGVTDGTKTTLDLAGTPAWPNTSPKGKITLVKEDGVWKIAAGEDWS